MTHGSLGDVHLIAAFVALAAGGWVFLIPKGTRWHRTLGHLYVTAMVVLNASALGIYRLTGSFGPFHVFALVALGTLAMAMGTVLLRRPRKKWIEAHAGWMAGSYMGLAAAFVAETSTRLLMPWVAGRYEGTAVWVVFWSAVAVTSLATIGAGVWLLRTRMEGAVAATPDAMRRERARLRAETEAAAHGG